MTTLPKPHIHAHYFVRDNANGEVHDEKKYVVQPAVMNPISVEEVTNQVRDQFAFTEYKLSYAFYKDGATEYIRFEGTLVGGLLKLTLDVFSCYCVPLNENQEPPF
jgi:hypothetical protein